MEWQVRFGLAAVVAVIGLYVAFNPLSVTGLVTGVVPWLLMIVGAVYLLATLLRRRRRFFAMLMPGLIGALLIYVGASMKFGDPSAAGPIPLNFLFALLLFGTGAAKLIMSAPYKQSRYFWFFIGSGLFSAIMGIIILFAWASVSASFIGVVLGLEIIADAIFLAALSLRDRDKEEAREALGGNPAAEGKGKPWF